MQSEFEQQMARKEADRKNELEALKKSNQIAMNAKEEEIQRLQKQVQDNRLEHQNNDKAQNLDQKETQAHNQQLQTQIAKYKEELTKLNSSNEEMQKLKSDFVNLDIKDKTKSVFQLQNYLKDKIELAVFENEESFDSNDSYYFNILKSYIKKISQILRE